MAVAGLLIPGNGSTTSDAAMVKLERRVFGQPILQYVDNYVDTHTHEAAVQRVLQCVEQRLYPLIGYAI